MTSLMKRTPRDLAPWTTFRDLEQQINQFFRDFPLATGISEDSAWVPAVDLTETSDAYLIEADLPGLKHEDIEVSVLDDVITIKGARTAEHTENDKGYRRIERSYGSFQRTFRVPGAIDADKVDARFEHGVLKVTLPKTPESKPKSIAVNVK